MSAQRATANYLTAVSTVAPEPEAAPAIDRREHSANRPESCPRCYGTGIEVIAGKGARRCHGSVAKNILRRTRIVNRSSLCSNLEECSDKLRLAHRIIPAQPFDLSLV